MANTPVCTDNLLQRPERRGKVRHPLGALAYLDIGTDNGGIVLDLSEDGLGLQAVAPLFGQRELNLRIQLPQCEMRIETAARIVWLSDSSRLAGVRFENLSAGARARIRDWIASHGLPSTLPGGLGYAVDVEPVSLPTGVPEMPAPPSGPATDNAGQREKWLWLMAEFQEGLSGQAPPAEAPKASEPAEMMQSANLAEPEPPVAPPTTPHPKPEIVSWDYGNSGLLTSSRQAPQRNPNSERLSGTSTEKQPLRRLKAPPSVSVPATAPSQPVSGPVAPGSETNPVQPVVGSALPVASATALTAPPRTPSFGYISPSLPNTEAAGAQSSLSTRPAPAPKVPEKRRRNQAIAVALFAVFAILCFGIGTWVGRQPARHSAAKIAASVPPVEVTAEASAPSSGIAAGASVKSAGIEETRKSKVVRTTGASRGIEKPGRAVAAGGQLHAPLSGAGSNALLAKREPLPVNSTGPSPVPPRIAPQPAEDSQPALFSAASAQNAATQGAVQTPSSSAESPAAPAAQVVDGYTLKPSDRFNPCHLTYRVEPTYPPEAQQKGIEGVVKIHLVIAADGSVQSERLISGPGPLVSAALDAAKYWRYFPALLNGQAIPTETDIAITFRLPH